MMMLATEQSLPQFAAVCENEFTILDTPCKGLQIASINACVALLTSRSFL
jgi:hypothetical protein